MTNMCARIVLTIVASIVLMGVTSTVNAADWVWKKSRVQVAYQEKPLAEALREVLANQNITAVVSDKLTGSVTGKFNMLLEEFFANMGSVFGLMVYSDGATLYVTGAAEARSRVISLRNSNIERFTRTLREMDILDRRYPLKVNEAARLVHVSGPPRLVEMVQDVAELMEEVPAGEQSARDRVAQYRSLPSAFRVFTLKYAWAQDTTITAGGRDVTIPGVASTIRRLVGHYPRGSLSELSGTTAGRTPSSANTLAKLRGSGMLERDGAALRQTPAQGLGGSSGSGGSSGLTGNDASMSSGRSTQVDGGYSGPMGLVNVSLPRVEADNRTNSILIHDLPDRLDRYQALIDALDIRPILIQIEATIVDVSSDSVDRLGIDWEQSTNNVVIGRGRGNGTGADAQFRQGAINISGQIAQNALPLAGLTTIVGNMGRYFLAQINALSREGKAHIQARPSVLTMGNAEAVLENNQTFFVRLAGEREVDLFNITAGTSMRVTPSVVDENGEKRVRLSVRIEDGSITGQVVDQIPVIQRSSVGTHAMISEGQSLLIGGYAFDVDRDVVSKVPFLGDVPALGALFSYRNKQVTRVERMFMITPRIINL